MCGRYANHVEKMREWSDIVKDWPADAVTGYNIAPTMTVPVVIKGGTRPMLWSLIPGWSDKAESKYATFNARIESASTKPAFRTAWKNGQTCLIPALGYYEWRLEDGRKQPYFVRSKSGSPIVFAGLYEPERDDVPASCTVLTRAADIAMAKLHKRIPIMASVDAATGWLNGDVELAHHMMRPDLQVYAVNALVNNVRSNGEALTEPLSQIQSPTGGSL